MAPQGLRAREGLEAAAAGLPIVATDLPALRESTPQSHHAYMYPPDDDAAAVANLRSVLADPALRSDLAQTAGDGYPASPLRHPQMRSLESTMKRPTTPYDRRSEELVRSRPRTSPVTIAGRSGLSFTFYRIALDPAVRPPWLERDTFVAPLVGLRAPSGKGAPIATALADGVGTFPIALECHNGRELLFDLRATLDLIRSERYPGAELRTPLVSRLPFNYSRLPPRLVGIASRVLARTVRFDRRLVFPHYPLDRSVDVLEHLAGVDRPRWPSGKQYAVVITHDVDTSWPFDSSEGRRWLAVFRSVESELGVRSAWYCVPTAVTSSASRLALRHIADGGHEIGIHGWRHDADMPSWDGPRLVRALRDGRDRLSLYDPTGYRAPWLSRGPRLYEALLASGYEYDSSVPTADFHRHSALANNGCCTVRPYQRGGVVEVPVTLPLDSMRAILGMTPATFWTWLGELARRVASASGVVVITTHMQPHHSARDDMIDGYRRLLRTLTADPNAWLALPREVATWARKTGS